MIPAGSKSSQKKSSTTGSRKPNELSQALSFSRMVAEIDEEERMNHNPKESNKVKQLIGSQRSQQFPINSSPLNNQERLRISQRNGVTSNNKNVQAKEEKQIKIIQNTRFLDQIKLIPQKEIFTQKIQSHEEEVDETQSKKFKKIFGGLDIDKIVTPKTQKSLGQKLCASVIMPQSKQFQEEQVEIEEQSVIMIHQSSVGDSSHFFQPNLDDSQPKGFAAQKMTPLNEYTINIKQISANQQQALRSKSYLFHTFNQSNNNSQEQDMKSSKLGAKRNSQKDDIKSNCTFNEKGVGICKKTSNPGSSQTFSNNNWRQSDKQLALPKDNKMLQVKISKIDAPKSSPDQQMRRKTDELCQVKLSKHNTHDRMISSARPKGNSNCKSNTGHLSEPDKHNSQFPQSVLRNSDHFEEELDLQQQQMANQMQTSKQSTIQDLIMSKLNKIQKEVVKITNTKRQSHEEHPDSHRQLNVGKSIKTITIEKIQKNKNIEPHFNSFHKNLRNSNGSLFSRQSDNIPQHIMEQIQYLKQKVSELEKKSSSSPEDRHGRHYSHRENYKTNELQDFTQQKYNNNLINHVQVKKMQQKISRKHSSLKIVTNDIDDTEISFPIFDSIPTFSDEPDSIVQILLNAFDIFNIDISSQPPVAFNKYLDHIEVILEGIGIILTWYYSGQIFINSYNLERKEKSNGGLVIEYYPDKLYFKGTLHKGRKKGFGVRAIYNGQKYKGQWSDDQYHGQGILINGYSKFIGSFLNGAKNGYGKEKFLNGDYYEGKYLQGKFHGKGRYIWSNYTNYEGDFKKGFIEGYGVWNSWKGHTYEGHFHRNLKHGEGIYTWSDGRIYRGKFQNGRKVKKSNRATIKVEDELSDSSEPSISQRNWTLKSQTEKIKFTVEKIGRGVSSSRKIIQKM